MAEFRTNDLAYWVALHRAYQLGSAGFALLERAFPVPDAAETGRKSERWTKNAVSSVWFIKAGCYRSCLRITR